MKIKQRAARLLYNVGHWLSMQAPCVGYKLYQWCMSTSVKLDDGSLWTAPNPKDNNDGKV